MTERLHEAVFPETLLISGLTLPLCARLSSLLPMAAASPAIQHPAADDRPCAASRREIYERYERTPVPQGAFRE